MCHMKQIRYNVLLYVQSLDERNLRTRNPTTGRFGHSILLQRNLNSDGTGQRQHRNNVQRKFATAGDGLLPTDGPFGRGLRMKNNIRAEKIGHPTQDRCVLCRRPNRSTSVDSKGEWWHPPKKRGAKICRD